MIGEAGITPLDINELVRLQKIVIGDRRFVHIGIREHGGFVGEHDRDTGMPIPEHISARAKDLKGLLEGLIEFEKRAALNLDAVVAAACLSFGFIYIHPFEDGNGRMLPLIEWEVSTDRNIQVKTRPIISIVSSMQLRIPNSFFPV